MPALLAAAGESNDRGSEHSLTFALIEIADAAETRTRMTSGNAGQRRAALIALDAAFHDQITQQFAGD